MKLRRQSFWLFPSAMCILMTVSYQSAFGESVGTATSTLVSTSGNAKLVPKWTARFGGSSTVPLAFAPDGTVYASYQTPTAVMLSAWTPDGALKWSANLGQSFVSANNCHPVIGNDGTVYMGVGKSIFAYRPNGSRLWTNGDGNEVHAITYARGILYASSQSGFIDGYDATAGVRDKGGMGFNAPVSNVVASHDG